MSDFKGIVLSNTIIHDADVLMNVLSEDGKICIKARGVLKPNAKNRSMTEVGCFSLFHTIDKMNQKVYLLKNAEKVKRFKNIENDLTKKTIYSCLLEVMNKTDYEFSEAICLVENLESCKNPYCLYAYFLCDLIKKSGISLVVDECVCCGNTSKLYGLSLYDGGFVCKECYDTIKHYHLSVNDLRNIRYCMHASLKDYTILEESTSITYGHIEYLIDFLHRYGEITIKSHAFLDIIQPLD